MKVTLRSDDSHSVHEVQLFACVSQRLHDLRSACANTLVLFQYCFSLHFYSLSCQPCFLWCLLLFYEYGTIKYKNSTHDTFFFLIPSSPNSSISDLERKVSVTLWERFRNTVTRLLQVGLSFFVGTVPYNGIYRHPFSRYNTTDVRY